MASKFVYFKTVEEGGDERQFVVHEFVAKAYDVKDGDVVPWNLANEINSRDIFFCAGRAHRLAEESGK